MLANEAGDALTTEVGIAYGQARAFPNTRAFGESIEGTVAATRQPLLLGRHEKIGTNLSYEGEAALCVPILTLEVDTPEKGLLGVLVLRHDTLGSHFTENDTSLARAAAGIIATAVVNARSAQDERKVVVQTLQEIAKRMDDRDPYTRNHSYRVAEVCTLLARKLRLDEETITLLRTGALLHEIGKIGISESILRKPGRLSGEEFEQLKWYPVLGYDICKPLGLSEEVLLLIRNHAEKLDGTGYSDSLKQAELPLPLRILCVADAFDAMSSFRPYREIAGCARAQ